MPAQHNDNYNLTVLTWDPKSGDPHGHTAIKLRFPVDPRGAQLIAKYCKNTKDPTKTIPYNITTDLETNNKYYEVYFSWWPSNQPPGFLLSDFSKDLETVNQHTPEVVIHYPEASEQHLDREIQKNILLFNSFATRLDTQENTNLYANLLENLNAIDRTKLLINYLHVYGQPTQRLPDSKISKQIAKSFKNFFNQNITDYIAFGRIPSEKKHSSIEEATTVTLPLVDSTAIKDKATRSFGLELERILSSMQTTISDGRAFNAQDKNSAATSLVILDSGIQEANRSLMAQAIKEVSTAFKDPKAWFFKTLKPHDAKSSAIQLGKYIDYHRMLEQYKDSLTVVKEFQKIIIKLKQLFTIKFRQNKQHLDFSGRKTQHTHHATPDFVSCSP